MADWWESREFFQPSYLLSENSHSKLMEVGMGSQEPKTREQRWSLKGTTALVTGGTRGIGYAIVEELAGFGARVHTCSRNQTELNERLKEWEAKGFKVSGSVCDLSSRTQRQELMETIASEFDGKLNILVNNAATVLMKRAENSSFEDQLSLMGTNLESPFHLSQLAYPLLKAADAGNIVFISSVAGGTALPGLSVYGATKGAIHQLTKNLACEWAKDNIRVNAVAPWAVRTSISKELGGSDQSLRAKMSTLVRGTPLRPIAEANEISPLVAFLCLPAASYITGQIMYIDGGYTAGAAA